MADDIGLPFNTRWTQDRHQAEQWVHELEHLGVAGVAARLAQARSGSAGDLSGVGPFNITRGFAEDWLAWRRSKDEWIDRCWRWAALILGIVTAIATSLTAISDYMS